MVMNRLILALLALLTGLAAPAQAGSRSQAQAVSGVVQAPAAAVSAVQTVEEFRARVALRDLPRPVRPVLRSRRTIVFTPATWTGSDRALE